MAARVKFAVSTTQPEFDLPLRRDEANQRYRHAHRRLVQPEVFLGLDDASDDECPRTRGGEVLRDRFQVLRHKSSVEGVIRRSRRQCAQCVYVNEGNWVVCVASWVATSVATVVLPTPTVPLSHNARWITRAS